jgi:hypothetical protein
MVRIKADHKLQIIVNLYRISMIVKSEYPYFQRYNLPLDSCTMYIKYYRNSRVSIR